MPFLKEYENTWSRIHDRSRSNRLPVPNCLSNELFERLSDLFDEIMLYLLCSASQW